MSGLVDFLRDRQGEILTELGQHVYLTVVAMALAVGVAVPLGLALTRVRRIADKVIAAVGAAARGRPEGCHCGPVPLRIASDRAKHLYRCLVGRAGHY